MPVPPISLVNLPKSLHRGIDRRLPRGAKFKNLTGQTFGNRAVLGFAGFRGAFSAWLCRCSCGKLSVAIGANLQLGIADSCGCVRHWSPAARKLRELHASIKARCHDPRCTTYRWYGGRGISMCRRWRESVEAFAADMGPRPSPKHIVARHNPKGNYTPSNCFWATRAEAGHKAGRLITYNGKTLNLAQWARELGISRERMRQLVNRCLKLGLDTSAAIATPRTTGRPRQRGARNRQKRVR
jgi:hypothetical protein